MGGNTSPTKDIESEMSADRPREMAMMLGLLRDSPKLAGMMMQMRGEKMRVRGEEMSKKGEVMKRYGERLEKESSQ